MFERSHCLNFFVFFKRKKAACLSVLLKYTSKIIKIEQQYITLNDFIVKIIPYSKSKLNKNNKLITNKTKHFSNRYLLCIILISYIGSIQLTIKY